MLLEIMEKTAAADPVGESLRLKEYEDLFDLQYISGVTSVPSTDLPLPAVNSPYQGVLVNPAQCLIDDGITSVIELRDYMDSQFSSNPDWTDFRPEFETQRTALEEDFARVENHTNRVTNNLPSLIGIAQGALAIATVVNLLSNPCLGLNGFLGSIMDEGKKLLADISAQVKAGLQEARDFVADLAGDLAADLGPLIADIRDTIAEARRIMGEVTAQIAKEIANFSKAMLQQVRQGLAELMASLPQDPCLRGLLTSVATGTAAAVL